MTEFFTMTTVEAALRDLVSHLNVARRTETLPVSQAMGRVLATAPTSPVDLPDFIRSTMDGFAVKAGDTFGASESLPAYLEKVGVVHMGSVPDFEIGDGQCAEIHTGAMLPRGADAVVMIERTQPLGESEIEVLAPVAPGENLVQIGEDVQQGAPVLPAGHRLRPQDSGGLLAVGITEVEVVVPPTVAILSCGDELIPPEETPQRGQIRDINAYVLADLFRQAGADVQLIGIARDTLDSFYPLAEKGLANADMLVMSAGSSVSVRDLTREVITRLGQPGVVQHGLAIKPGKPTILAACDGKPVIGLPGNPVSATLVARLTVVPLIAHLLGETPRPQATIRATLTQNVASASGRFDTVPVILHATDEGYEAEPVFGKSNLIFRLVNADGLIHVPLNLGGFKAGSAVDVIPF